MTGSPEEMHIKCLGNVTENSREHHLGAFEDHYQHLTRKIEWGGMENILDMHIHRKQSTQHLLWTRHCTRHGDKLVRKGTVAAFDDAYTLKGKQTIKS